MATMAAVGTLTLVNLVLRGAGKSTNQLGLEEYPIYIEELPNSCTDLEDGYHWIRPLTTTDSNGDEYPNIYVKCVDGYNLIDPSLFALDNYHHPSAYFSSYSDITDFMASSSMNDHVTWRQWFIPAEKDSSFRVSEDCQSCVETEEHGAKSTYYMTGNYNGCLWITKGYCDMDPDTLECSMCSANTDSTVLTGLCSHVEQGADHLVPTQHSECVGTNYNQFPSIGSNGEFCVCYKADSSTEMVPAGEWVLPDAEEGEANDANTIIEVYASDFATGTYRITSPGIYMVMEDIMFEMRSPIDKDDPMPNDSGAWYPAEDQEDDYMGAGGTFIGPYSMGFFAGFAVESDDVTIDLNGHELKMSKTFHHQQRWFSIIEVGSKSFISGQGPGFFGPYMTYADNVVIKNGIIGLSSHHGIHANGFENLQLSDLVVRHFEVGGLSLNGFTTLTIERVEVGPVYTEVPVMGVYTQARIMLPRLRAIMETNPEGSVTFHNRPGKYTAADLYDELTAQMDIVFDHNINGVDFADMHEDEDRINMAIDTFQNKNGLPSSSTVYGIFLNSNGASVFAISGSPGHSESVTVEDVHIHGLYKDPWEVPRIALTKGPFNDIMDLTRHSTDGLQHRGRAEELTQSQYVGSAYTDVQYAIHQLTDDWVILGHSVLGKNDTVLNWIQNGKFNTESGPNMVCNGDVMLHVTKGVFGLRIDNVYDVAINNLVIEDLHNVGQLGSYICGHYETDSDGGHRNQNFPLQRGYTGTEVHALSMVSSSGTMDNVKISNIVSARGDAMAIQLFPSNELQIGANIEISDIHAGSSLNTQAVRDLQPHNFLPNKVPRACGLTVWTWTDGDDYVENQIEFVDKHAISAKCITGHTFCSDSDYDAEALQDVGMCDDTTIVSAKAHAMDNGLIYSEFIRPLSAQHEKLFAIAEGHDDTDVMRIPKRKASNFGSKVNSIPLQAAPIVSAAVMLLVAGFYRYRASTEKKMWLDVRGDLQPLIQ